MTMLDRNGVKIFYRTFGNEGPTVLLSHGYSATSAMWNPQVKDLQRDFRLVVWDMRGHGDSDSPNDPALYSEAETVADMAAILDAVGARTAVIGGLSLGVGLTDWGAKGTLTALVLLLLAPIAVGLLVWLKHTDPDPVDLR